MLTKSVRQEGIAIRAAAHQGSRARWVSVAHPAYSYSTAQGNSRCAAIRPLQSLRLSLGAQAHPMKFVTPDTLLLVPPLLPPSANECRDSASWASCRSGSALECHPRRVGALSLPRVHRHGGRKRLLRSYSALLRDVRATTAARRPTAATRRHRAPRPELPSAGARRCRTRRRIVSRHGAYHVAGLGPSFWSALLQGLYPTRHPGFTPATLVGRRG